MIKVLIVDDEPNICFLIKNLIDWNALNLTYVGEAHSGKEALQKIENERPDIVIADIRMPEMDGLALLKHIHSTYGRPISFIIVSGFQQFDYAYEAIKYGAVDFLLKPINQQELNATLQRLINANLSESPTEASSVFPQKMDYILQKQFLMDILSKNIDAQILSIQKVNSDYHYHFEDGSFLGGVIHVENIDKLGRSKDSILDHLSNYFRKSLSHSVIDIGIYPRNQQIWFVLNYDVQNATSINTSLAAMAKELKGTIRSYEFLKMTIGISSECELRDLGIAMNQAGKVVNNRVILGAETMYNYGKFDERATYKALSNINEFRNEIKSALELLDLEAIIDVCDNYFHLVMSASQKAPFVGVERIQQKAQHMVVDLIHQHAQELLPEYSNSALFDMSRCHSLTELRAAMKTVVTDSYNQVAELKHSHESAIITKVKKYIANHYTEQITLDEVANHVYLSASYLGVLFKNETGELFSQYLTKYKMEKAKDLLRNFELSIKEIAYQLGYKDIRNFSRLFKTHAGVKPTEYRKLYRLDTR